jgi:gas vesicle protein
MAAASFPNSCQQGMRRKEVWMMRFLVGFLLGMLIGAFIALALAPQPGSETRSIIVERVRQRARRGEESASGAEEA